MFESVVKPKIIGKRTYIYGTSLGGYSSIYYGGIIDATIIAGAPMLSLISKRNHPRYRDIQYKHIPIKDTKKTSEPVFIIYDPLVGGDINFIKKKCFACLSFSSFYTSKKRYSFGYENSHRKKNIERYYSGSSKA